MFNWPYWIKRLESEKSPGDWLTITDTLCSDDFEHCPMDIDVDYIDGAIKIRFAWNDDEEII